MSRRKRLRLWLWLALGLTWRLFPLTPALSLREREKRRHGLWIRVGLRLRQPLRLRLCPRSKAFRFPSSLKSLPAMKSLGHATRLTRLDGHPALPASNAYLHGRRHLRAAKVAEIQPLEAGGIASWFDAGNGTGCSLPGDPVAQWTDATANGNDLAQGTAASRPVWYPDGGPNGLPRIVFDGVDDYLAATSCGFVSAEATVFLVMNKKDAPAVGWAISADAFSSQDMMFLTGRPLHHTAYGNWSGRPHQTTFDTGFHVHTLSFGKEWSQIDYWVDGIQANGAYQLTGAPVANAAVARLMVVGRSPEGANPTNATFCELILFNQLLSERVRAGVELYLRNKYAL